MKVYVVGEDDATRAIIYRVIEYCQLKNIEIAGELPARGGQIKQQMNKFNTLSNAFPVILLTDLDNAYCAPSLIQSWNIENKSDKFILNIAVDEAEAWLMADRENFSKYFQVSIDTIPSSHQTKMMGRTWNTEMDFPCKSSFFLTRNIIPNSQSEVIKKQMLPEQGAVKGKEYNVAMTPFIKQYWNVENAMKNSDSLKRMVERLKSLAS